jgi:hypothetical protein
MVIVSGNALLQELEAAFSEAEGEPFEDGMESTVSKSLLDALHRDGEKTMDAVEAIVFAADVHPEVAAEALRWLGQFEHASTRERRRLLLEQCLTHRSYLVRDGAITGLGYVDDRLSAPAVQKALERESEAVLRRDMEKMLQHWEASL